MSGDCTMCDLSSISSNSDLFSRTENLKTCYKAYYQEVKDFFGPTGKLGSSPESEGRALACLGHAVKAEAAGHPVAVPAHLASCPQQVRPSFAHSSKQSFYFPSFETKQFPPNYGFRHHIGNST